MLVSHKKGTFTLMLKSPNSKDLQYFPREWQNGFGLNVSCVYVCDGQKKQHEHNLCTDDSKMADAVTNFHPASCVLNL